MNRYYQFLDEQINAWLDITVGFENLIATAYHAIEDGQLAGFFSRYQLLRSFQEITLNLFKASLKGDFDPELADLVLNELPAQMGKRYHKRLTDRQHRPPLFFRTDEVAPGKIVEIQCPGSSWGLYEQVYQFCCEHRADFGRPVTFPRSLAAAFASAAGHHLNSELRIHHLLDNSATPHGNRFFIQSTRRYGLKYFGFDKDITPYHCNLVRSHDFVSLFNNNFARQRLIDCEEGRLFYDFPPSTLYEQKVIFTFPFWAKTRDYYTDEIRNLFPPAHLIRPEGLTLEDGTLVSLDAFSKMSRKQRGYFLKYAGCDISLNWGSRGVFNAAMLSHAKTRSMLDHIIKGYGRKKYWIIQKSHLHATNVNYLTRDGGEEKARVYSKYSGFYGPDGLMGLLVMERPFHKVHGSVDTIVSICR